jgi:hypothetical protein
LLPEPLASSVLKFVKVFNEASRGLLIAAGLGVRDPSMQPRSKLVPFSLTAAGGDAKVAMFTPIQLPLASVLNKMASIDASVLASVTASEADYEGVYAIKRFRAKDYAGYDLAAVFNKIKFGDSQIRLTKSGQRLLLNPAG